MQTDERKTFSCWGLIELMGHQRIAGLITEETIAGKGMLRVDVPNADGSATLFTRWFSPEAVYAINPTDHQIAVGLANKCAVRPVTIYDLEKLIEDKKAGDGEQQYSSEEFDR